MSQTKAFAGKLHHHACIRWSDFLLTAIRAITIQDVFFRTTPPRSRSSQDITIQDITIQYIIIQDIIIQDVKIPSQKQATLTTILSRASDMLREPLMDQPTNSNATKCRKACAKASIKKKQKRLQFQISSDRHCANPNLHVVWSSSSWHPVVGTSLAHEAHNN